MGSIGRDAVGDAEMLGVEPAHFPESVIRAPEGAKPPGALAQLGFLVTDAHGDHFFISPARSALAARPRHGFDDQFHGLVSATGLRVIPVAHADEALDWSVQE